MKIKSALEDLRNLRRKADGDFYTPDIRAVAKRYGTDHDLALGLWDTGFRPARALALEIADPAKITKKLLESWVRDLDEWGLCDGFTAQIVRPTPWAVQKAAEWAERDAEFEKRAGFSLMAQMAWQKNDYKDKIFMDFLPLVEKHASDDRFYVKKAVNWALRDIGKRSRGLRKKALATAGRLQKSADKTAQWIGRHRIGEIENAHFGD